MFLNARIVGSGVTQWECTESKSQNVLSAMVLTSLTIIGSLCGAAKLTLSPTHLDSKYKRVNLALTISNVSIARDRISRTQTNVHSGNTTSIENGTQRNTLISRKLGENQHTLM